MAEDQTQDALEDQTQDTDTGKGENTQEDNKDPIQQIKSWVGRLDAQSKEDRKTISQILTTVQTISERFETQQAGSDRKPVGSPDLTELNTRLSDKILQGDVIGALDEYTNLLRNAEMNISEQNQHVMETELGKRAEDPVFPHIKDEVLKKASSLVSKGHKAKDAIEYAWANSEAKFLKGLVATIGKENPGALDLLKGGKSRGSDAESSSKGKLPPEFEAACQKDLKAGLFKDRKEWIAFLNPAIRKQIGV